jgi:hypothetical protein
MSRPLHSALFFGCGCSSTPSSRLELVIHSLGLLRKDFWQTVYHKSLWEAPGSSEQLYDLTADPWEMQNLAKDPACSGKLAALRERLKATMKETHDTGLVPEPLFENLAGEGAIATHVHSDAFDINKIADLAFAATEMKEKNLPTFREAVKSKDPVERYWGANGLLQLTGKSTEVKPDDFTPLLNDAEPIIRMTAAEAIFKLDQKDIAAQTLIADVAKEMNSASLLNLLNAIRRLNLLDQLPKDRAKGKAMKGADFDYIKRFTERATEE